MLLLVCADHLDVILHFVFFFFFQAEDGIRDLYVTGVQTCALPICPARTRSISSTCRPASGSCRAAPPPARRSVATTTDRKSTRLNSSHVEISYAVFCLKKKKQ